jgi:uncharacterized protein DUF4242
MPEYLAELYLPRSDGTGLSDGAERARHAAEELSRQGTRVRYLHSIFVPEDETCFFLFDADSADDVRIAAHRADLALERVSEALTESKGVLQ